MLRKLFFSIAAAAALLPLLLPAPAPTALQPASDRRNQNLSAPARPADLSRWFIEDETSRWSSDELEAVGLVLRNTVAALESLGPDFPAMLEGYRFRRFAGEYARDREGKIALVNHQDREVILSDTALLPENAFFIYHELGHIIDHRTDRALDGHFHLLTLETEGATTLHEWTTAQTFFLRGQAHIKHTEATADAFALWVWVDFAGEAVPHFHDTPENADPEAILEVFRNAIDSVIAR